MHSKVNSRSSFSGFPTPARPVPKFFQEPSFSHKKNTGSTPHGSLPPRPPAKSLPSVSRLFPHRSRTEDENRATNVSFRQADNSVLQSPHYNQSSGELYFDQCFRVERRLGAGSFGEVFKVQSKEDGGYYAVKRSRDRFRGESDKRRKLEEVKKHESLSKHPNCVEFYKAWAERGHLYIQTELCKMTLQSYAEQNHKIPERILWSFLVDLIQGLHHMHSHGLLHLDVKPENIFISFGKVCKLGDFGLSVQMNEHDFTDAQEGDPKYLAPELLQGHFGMHADVFSLGITIFELASDLELPRNGDSWHDLRRGRIPWQLTAGISSDLKGLIKNMMNPDFQKRPSLAELMETSVVQRTIAWQRRKRALSRMWNKFQGFLSLLFTLLSAAVFKILSPSKHSINQDEIDAPVIKHRHPSSWDLSFSDDEIFESDTSHGSLGCPLGSLSFSSEEDACNIQHTKAIHNSKNILTPSTPTLLKKKKCGGPTPRSSSPITKHRQPAKLSPCGSPNVSLVRDAEWMGTPTRPSPSRTSVLLTPRCTPSKLDFSSIDSETERHSCMIEPRSLSLEFDELGEDSD
ncbi:membrane-associated tyrosine- and threonine-specific cdc2-inhibitory kinase-like [Lytechinus variegatus]|uniref:membrane-associated tyrosine- and threonine-specific cdc2-inhibitory kinase-like n=1 Tax=Lytechinus variegatus TaxID=7654 RepID=UPI001BB22599|nr:membrane-associated tyrosine- and threonine-specific cdc2-inhibitory kinase-like [Lytechinus variegatus]